MTRRRITAAIADVGARLRSRQRSLRLPDALVLASADALGADVILTGDELWARLSKRVVVIREG